MSAACAFSSCTQTTSAFWGGSQSKKPLVAADRMPLRLADIILIAFFYSRKVRNVRLQSRVCGIRHCVESAVFWRVQDQGGANEPLLLQRGAVQRRRQAETVGRILR